VLFGEPGGRLIAAIAGGAGDRRALRALDRPLRSLARESEAWWLPSSVRSLAIARKRKGGQLGEPCLAVFVRKKRPESKLPPERVVPKELDGAPLGWSRPLPTDVRERPRVQLEHLIELDRPAHPGYNIGDRSGGDGTIACAVRPVGGGETLLLTCAHVAGGLGAGQPGDLVLVPSRRNAEALGAVLQSRFGELVRALPLSTEYEDRASNLDAAILRPTDPGALDADVALLGRKPAGVRPLATLSLGEPVHKVGSTTELTQGTISELHVTISIPYPSAGLGTRSVWFSEMIGVTRFTAAGDSGALVLDADARAVGLHVGSAGETSLCLPIERVLAKLDCELVT
jgi:hypothetical protein